MKPPVEGSIDEDWLRHWLFKELVRLRLMIKGDGVGGINYILNEKLCWELYYKAVEIKEKSPPTFNIESPKMLEETPEETPFIKGMRELQREM